MALLRAAWAPPLNIILKVLLPLPTHEGRQEIGPDGLSLSHHGNDASVASLTDKGCFPTSKVKSLIESRSFEICQLSKAEGGKAAVAKASSDTCDLPWDGERAYPSRVTKRSRLKRIRFSATWGNLDWRR